MSDNPDVVPESSAVRVALWRALHVEVDAPPHVLQDDIGQKIASPSETWRSRPDMHVQRTKLFRASIVGRARFVEDLVIDEVSRGVAQYVILGAGLDTFVQRHPELANQMTVFEVDQPGPQTWKRQRLIELGYGVGDWLRFVAVDFEAGDNWWTSVIAAGFDANSRAVAASTGVSMYLTPDTVVATLGQLASLTPGSTVVMSFMLPIELTDPEVRAGIEAAAKGARANGTPWLSFFTPEQMLRLAREAGFKEVEHVPSSQIAHRYFAGRPDGLRPPNSGEDLLVAKT